MTPDQIREQLGERLKLREYYTGLQSGDGAAAQIRNYHKLHSLYDEHDVDRQIRFLLDQLGGFEKVTLPGGLSVRRVAESTLQVYDLALKAHKAGLLQMFVEGTLTEGDLQRVVLETWREAAAELFRLLLGDIDLSVPQEVQSGRRDVS